MFLELQSVFWKLIHHFVKNEQYRILHISDDHNEIWLENIERPRAEIIRILRHDLDWSSWMQRDMENTLERALVIKKNLWRKKLHVLNVYISAYPPVDEWNSRIEQPLFSGRNNETVLETIIIYHSELAEGLKNLAQKSQSILPEEILHPVYDFWEIDELRQRTLSLEAKRAKKEQDLFRYGKPFYTYVFIAAQLFMYFLMEMSGGSTNIQTLIHFGAKYTPLILEGEWWRFFTPIVLHIGLIHLLMNTVALYYLGTAVERIYGNSRFLFIYLFAGFAGTVSSFVFSPSVSAGASGAIFGCFGALLFFGLKYKSLFFRTIGMNIISLVGINILFGILMPGIDNAGHIGGLIGGFLASSIVHLPNHKALLSQSVAFLFTVVMTAVLLFIGFQGWFMD
jgi:rhomboid protease GluP